MCLYRHLCRVAGNTYSSGKSDLTDMVCYKRLDSLDPLQQLLGGQFFQQATVTLKFKMTFKMVAISLHIVTNCYYIVITSFLVFEVRESMMVSACFLPFTRPKMGNRL